MKKNIFFIILVTTVIVFSLNGQDNMKVEIKEWKYGFAFDNHDNPMYYDYDNDNSSLLSFHKTKRDMDKVNSEIIKDQIIIIRDKYISINAARKDKPNTGIGQNQKIKYKIKKNSGYVSSDGKKWEKLNIKYYKETNEKDIFGNPLILVNFECSFFSGEYQFDFE